jgi:chromosome segregation ATPase
MVWYGYDMNRCNSKLDTERKKLQSTTTEREAYRQDGDNLRRQLDAQRAYSTEVEAKLKMANTDIERLTSIINTARAEQDKEINAIMGRWQGMLRLFYCLFFSFSTRL